MTDYISTASTSQILTLVMGKVVAGIFPAIGKMLLIMGALIALGFLIRLVLWELSAEMLIYKIKHRKQMSKGIPLSED